MDSTAIDHITLTLCICIYGFARLFDRTFYQISRQSSQIVTIMGSSMIFPNFISDFFLVLWFWIRFEIQMRKGTLRKKKICFRPLIRTRLSFSVIFEMVFSSRFDQNNLWLESMLLSCGTNSTPCGRLMNYFKAFGSDNFTPVCSFMRRKF